MPIYTFPYQKTGYFSKLMCDYLTEKEELAPFYGFFPKLENFQKQIESKQLSIKSETRMLLVEALKRQYKNITTSESTLHNISSLSETNTFTITTGHQLNLFTGPLYFLFKIFSVINLSEKLRLTYPKANFVPVYWMATEDHDFAEINYFNLFGKKIQWDRNDGGAVGELSTEGLADLIKKLKAALGDTEHANRLCSLFSDSYVEHENLTDATRYLGNQLFSEFGLVIVDGNDPVLKKTFTPYIEKELFKKQSYTKVTKTSKYLEKLGYPQQVHPREINLFYLGKGIRERIIERDGNFYVNNTDRVFSKDEIRKEIQDSPERFSPNALLRPLYQEVVMPNLCYVGGGGELAYWFQLKDYFDSAKVPFPILLLRNSVLIVPHLYSEKLTKLDVDIESLFLPNHELEEHFIKQLSEIKIDFSKQKEHLIQQFEALYETAKKTDGSFFGAVAAQEKKQLNGLMNLEKRLLKAQKRKKAEQLSRLIGIQDELFPNQNLQERIKNFSEFYLVYGDLLFEELKENLDPLAHEFSILSIN